MLTTPSFNAIRSNPIFAPCKGIQDSIGFWIPSHEFRIPGTGFQILVSGFQRLVGFRIPSGLFWISKPRILHSTSNFFHIPDPTRINFPAFRNQDATCIGWQFRATWLWFRAAWLRATWPVTIRAGLCQMLIWMTFLSLIQSKRRKGT